MTDSSRSTLSVTIMRNACLAALSAGLLIAGAACTSSQPASVTDTAKPAGVDLYVQSLSAGKAGNQEQQIALLEKAVTVNPDLRMARTALADAYRTRGDYQRAATQYEASTRLDKYSLSNHYNLGLSYQFLNRLQDAAASYLKALQLNPKDVKSNMNLGVVYLALGDNNSAILYLQKATQLDPANFQAWSNLGVAFDSKGSVADAEATYRKAIELNSNDQVVLQNLAQNLISQKKSDEAIQIMQQALAKSDTPAAHKRYGDALVSAKKFDEAIAQYDLAIKADPQYTSALAERGFAMIGKFTANLQLDDKLRTGALESWKSSLRQNPGQPRVIEAVRKWEAPALFGN